MVQMLGEILYPLVDQLEHEHAAKVTGMILEMGTTEVLHLLESPTELRLMVAETMDVLRDVLNDVAREPMPNKELASSLVNTPAYRRRMVCITTTILFLLFTHMKSLLGA